MPDTADGNQKSERHVRFAGTEVKNEHGSELPQIKSFESKLTQPTLAPPPEDTELIPRRIELKDPKTHLAVASCLLFFLLVLAFQMDDVADVKQKAERDATKGRTKTMGRYAMVQDRFKDKIEKSFEAEPRRDLPCSFFLASSSLPGVQGFGIYAGTKFDEGASVLNLSTVAYAVDGSQGEPLLVSHYGFLLGHHHILHNLHGGPLWTASQESEAGSGVVLKASRTIKEGEELFLNFYEHPASALGGKKFSFPTQSDFELAHEIIRDELDYLRPFRGRAQTAKPDEGAFRLIRKTVDKLNKHAAKMLPLSTNELTGLDLRGEPLGLASMRNKTMEWLRRYGQCLDDAELKESDNSVSLVAKRQFKFGDVVLPIPLYATTSHDVCTSGNAKEECSVGLQSFYRHCYGHNETSLLLCPLSFAALATRSDDPNVMLRWSPWNSENKASQHHTPDHVVKGYSQSLTWDLVAVKGIEAGEKINLRMDLGSANFGAYIPEELIPATWRNLI